MNNDTNTDTETEEYLTEESTQLKQIIRKNTIFLDHTKKIDIVFYVKN